jgi:hypothetical protein
LKLKSKKEDFNTSFFSEQFEQKQEKKKATSSDKKNLQKK